MDVLIITCSCFSHINKKTTFTDPRLAFAEPLKTSPADFKQKFDGNSTALQVLNGRDLTGKFALITGASDGIGKFQYMVAIMYFAITGKFF